MYNYSSEVCGFHKCPDMENVHTDFCKNLLGVKKSTPYSMNYPELGIHPLVITRFGKYLTAGLNCWPQITVY